MDGSRPRSGDRNSSTGRQTPQLQRQSTNDSNNIFNPANFLGSSGLSSAFPQSLFPSSFFPFSSAAGFGPTPTGDVPQRSGGDISMDVSGADWWRFAAEQAKLLAEYATGSGFCGGLGANPFANPLLMPPFGPYVPGMEQMGSSRSNTSPAPSSHRSPASQSTPMSNKSPATKDVHSRTKSPASIGSRGTTSRVRTPESRGTPTWVKSPGPRGTPNAMKSADCPPSLPLTPAKDSTRKPRDSTSTASRVATPADKLSGGKDRHGNAPSGGDQMKRSKHFPSDESDRRSAAGSKQSVSDYYSSNSLLSAEAAAAQSAMFFPFALPSPFSSQALLTSPFAGSSLFPYMPTAAASALGSVYQPSLFGADMFTNKTDLTQSDHSKASVSNKNSSSKTGTTSSTAVDSVSGRHRRSPHHGGRNQQDTDWRDVGGGLKTDASNQSSPVVKRRDEVARSMTSSSHRDHDKRHRVADVQISSRKSADEKSRGRPSSSMSSQLRHGNHSAASDDALKYTENGAMDLSMKKPRRSSPAPPSKPPTPKAGSNKLGRDRDVMTTSSNSTVADDKSSMNMLNALANSHKAYAEQAAMMQFLTGHQMAGPSSGLGGDSNADLSLSLAAAAALLPPVYDSLTGLFYSPSALATMAAANSGRANNTSSSQPNKLSSSSSSSSQSQVRASRGRRRGSTSGSSSSNGRVLGARPSSSNFISNLMPKLGREEQHGRQEEGSNSKPTAGSAAESERGGIKHQFNQMRQHDVEPLPLTKSSHNVEKSSSSMSDNASSSVSMTTTPSKNYNSLLRHEKPSCHQSKSEQPVPGGKSLLKLSHGGGDMSACNGYAKFPENNGSLGTESVNSNVDSGSENSWETASAAGDDLSSQEGQGRGRMSKRVKRKLSVADGGGGGGGKKRRHFTAAEMILYIPLERRWRRETRVYSWLPQKVVGEVTYTTPCGTKLCSVGELKQYFEKNSITDLTEDNFSFNANVNVGQFCQQVTAKDGTSELIHLTEDIVADRFRDIAIRPIAPSSHVDNKLHDVESEQLMQKMVESMMHRKTDTQGLDMTKIADWQKMAHQDLMSKDSQLMLSSSAGQSMTSDSSSFSSPFSMSNMTSSTSGSSSDVNMQYYTYLLHAAQQQRHKEQQQEHHKMMVAAMAMEKEQRRQDLLAAKVLEVRKKEEEKERIKEEKKCAKKLEQDRKLAQKRYELFMALERMRPVEDLTLPDSKPLPKLDRIPGVRLPSKAFADCLTVLEFVHNYASVLGLESDSIPALSTLQGGLLHEESHVDEFLRFTRHLVKLVIEDPGVVNPKEGVTLSGQKLADVDLSGNNISEVLRILIKSRLGHSDDLTNLLTTRSFLALNPTQKASILAFVCNELLSSKNVTADIEKTIETVSNLRRDKLINEGKLRKFRYQLSRTQRKLSTVIPTTPKTESVSIPATPVTVTPSEDSNMTLGGVTASLADNTDTDSDNITQRSETASNATTTVHDSDTEEDKKATAEDLELKIDKLLKQQNQLRQRIQSSSHKLSATCLGQDRYRRRYWVLPRFGGVLVEGVESGEPESVDPSAIETDEIAEAEESQKSDIAVEKIKIEKCDAEYAKGVSLDKTDSMECKNAPETTIDNDISDIKLETPLDDTLTNSAVEADRKSELTAEGSNICVAPGSEYNIDMETVKVESNLKSECQTEKTDFIKVEKLDDSSTVNCVDGIGETENCLSENSDVSIEKSKDLKVVNGIESDEHLPCIGGSMDKTSDSSKVDLISDSVSQPTLTNSLQSSEAAQSQKWRPIPVASEPTSSDTVESPKWRPIPVASELTSSEIIESPKWRPIPAASELTSPGTIESSKWRPIPASSELPSASLMLSLVMQNVTKDNAANNLETDARDNGTCSPNKDSTSDVAAADLTKENVSNDRSEVVDGASVGQSSTPASASSLDAAVVATLDVAVASSVVESNVSSTSATSVATAAESDISATVAASVCTSAALNVYATVDAAVDAAVDADVATTRPPSDAVCTVDSATTHVKLAVDLSYDKSLNEEQSSMASDSSASNLMPLPEPGTHPEFDTLVNKVSDVTLLMTPVEDLIALSVSDGELPPDCLAEPKNIKPIPLEKQRGWWRISNPDKVKELISCLNTRGVRERILNKSLEKHVDYICQMCNKTKKNAVYLELIENSCKEGISVEYPVPPPDDEHNWNSELQRRMELSVLKEIDNIEERVCSASLQGWKMPPRVTLDESIELVCSDVATLQSNQQHTIEVARDKLLFVEYNIERRYLKQPFGPGNQLKLASMPSSSCNSSRDVESSSDEDSDESDDEDTPTRELVVWRSAVSSATSASQLGIYITQLNQTIAWEKSIMKVICQICCQDNNEAELLLCDICDRGYHTYCIQPKMQSIPEGDWFCYECLAKAAGEAPCCLICGQRGSRLATCEFCHRRCHLDCMDPPLARMPKKWTCNSCATEKGKSIRKRNRPSTSSSAVKDAEKEGNTSVGEKRTESADKDVEMKVLDESMDLEQCDPPSVCDMEQPPSLEEAVPCCDELVDDVESNEEKSQDDIVSSELPVPSMDDNNVVVEDLSVCRTVLAEMRKHADAWPFQTPVSVKQFPSYRKIVQSPMDFQTISKKLKNHGYNTRDEFAADTRRVFVNCELFNEDDSSVGRAGHVMYEFFEKRWTELTSDVTNDST